METAANDVRDKVSIAQRYLPRDTTHLRYQLMQTRSIMQITGKVEPVDAGALEYRPHRKERLQAISNVGCRNLG